MVAAIVHFELVAAPELMLAHKRGRHERIGRIGEIAVDRLPEESAISGWVEPPGEQAFHWREIGRRPIE